jgi:hypothetical protein
MRWSSPLEFIPFEFFMLYILGHNLMLNWVFGWAGLNLSLSSP